jgi:hypothetical protein
MHTPYVGIRSMRLDRWQKKDYQLSMHVASDFTGCSHVEPEGMAGYLVLHRVVPGGSGILAPLVIKLCKMYGDKSQRNPRYRCTAVLVPGTTVLQARYCCWNARCNRM